MAPPILPSTYACEACAHAQNLRPHPTFNLCCSGNQVRTKYSDTIWPVALIAWMQSRRRASSPGAASENRPKLTPLERKPTYVSVGDEPEVGKKTSALSKRLQSKKLQSMIKRQQTLGKSSLHYYVHIHYFMYLYHVSKHTQKKRDRRSKATYPNLRHETGSN